MSEERWFIAPTGHHIRGSEIAVWSVIPSETSFFDPETQMPVPIVELVLRSGYTVKFESGLSFEATEKLLRQVVDPPLPLPPFPQVPPA